MSSVAEATRETLRERPFLHEALRAGALNYRAAADVLDVDADPDTVAAALRRYAADVPPRTSTTRRIRVTVRRNDAVDVADADGDGLLRVGDVAVVDGGNATAFVATGEVDATSLVSVLARLEVAGVPVVAAAVGGDALAVVVDGGTRHLATVEDALADVTEFQS
jgi:hypothetical protein